MPNIIGLHIIPNKDTGCRHRAVATCKCSPSKNTSANPKVPIYTHNTVGDCNNLFKIKVQSDAKL